MQFQSRPLRPYPDPGTAARRANQTGRQRRRLRQGQRL